jgi:peptidase E
MDPRILAIGGGGFLMEDAPSPVDAFIVELTGRATAKICFIPTPGGDAVGTIDRFYETFESLRCRASHLAFFRPPLRASLRTTDYAQALLDHDAIFVGSGNTRSALAVWREWGLDRVLREAWHRGILLCGMSAGAMCWFEEGLTDAYWGDGMTPLRCLGFLPGGCGVHYGSDPARRVRLHQEVARGAGAPRIAIDDGAAVLYSRTTVCEVVAWRPGATAYDVVAEHGRAVERAHAARTLA